MATARTAGRSEFAEPAKRLFIQMTIDVEYIIFFMNMEGVGCVSIELKSSCCSS